MFKKIVREYPMHYDINRNKTKIRLHIKRFIWDWFEYEYREGIVKELQPPAKQIFDALKDNSRWEYSDFKDFKGTVKDLETGFVFFFETPSWICDGMFRIKGIAENHFNTYEQGTLAIAAREVCTLQRAKISDAACSRLWEAYVK